MNFLKSVFIFLAPVWLVFVMFMAIKGFLKNEMMLINISLVLSAVPLLLFLSYIMLFKKLARTSEHLFAVTVPSLSGYVIVLFVFIQDSSYSHVDGIMYTLSAFFCTFLYVYWYSNNSRKISDLISNKHLLPEFAVTDPTGNMISSREFLGNPTLIFFYRGNWCPLCMAQIDEVASRYKKFEEKKINVVFIAPQSSENTQHLAKKYNLSFKFYSDEGNKVADQLGLVHSFGLPMGFQGLGYDSHSVYPTIIATDAKGMIIYNDQTSNYRVRPEPEDLLILF